MDLVGYSIRHPVTVAVGAILLVMFGLIGLGAIPIQLTPTVDEPIVTVTTAWPGRSPQEVVDEIAKEQEEQLKNVGNLKSMRSISREGSAEITLQFYLGSDIGRALQEVSDSMRQVPSYPEEVEEPRIEAVEGSTSNAIAWIIVDLDPAKKAQHPDFDISTIQDRLDKEVIPYLERVGGVAEVRVYGGREREIRLLIDPVALAQRGLTLEEAVRALQGQNRNVSAGSIAEGKRDYRVRVTGRFTSVSDILDTAIAFREGRPVYYRDIGEAELGYEKKETFVRSLGEASLAIPVFRQTGANVMWIMRDLRERLDVIRREILPTLDPVAGPALRMRQLYDETTYIQSAIDLVVQNLWVGGGIATAVLLLFLRHIMPTLVIGLAIPLSVIGTFLVMLGLGRTLNVISLAGLAFAVGMVVDNGIVVLENIYRRMTEKGENAHEAALYGGREVWGAILASTLTTVAVFIPVITMREESGQLFRDISIAVVASVTLSLYVSITVVPTACARLHAFSEAAGGGFVRRLLRPLEGLFGLVALCSAFVSGTSRLVRWLITGWRAHTLRPALIAAMTLASLLGAWILMPPLDYLPTGNRNLVFGGLLIPPGYSLEQKRAIAERVESQVEPYVRVNAKDPAALAKLPKIPRPMEDPLHPFEPMGIENFFIGGFQGSMFMGATSQEEQVVIPVGQILTNAMNTQPDVFGGARQASIFGRGASGDNSINLEISGVSLERVRAAAGMMFGLAAQKFGYSEVRPNPPNFNLSQQEWRLALNDTGHELGLTNAALGVIARALFDGQFVGEYQLGSDNIDMLALPKGGRLEFKEQMRSVPIYSPAGRIVPLDSVATLTPSLAPQEIQRIEELPSVTVQIAPPKGRPLEEVMADVEKEIIGPARAAGLLDETMRVNLEGVAAKLDEVRASLFGVKARSGVPWLWRAGMEAMAGAALVAGAALGLWALGRAARRRAPRMGYGAAAFLLLGLTAACLFLLAGFQPQLGTARFIWALAVTYLLMCSLFESFSYPLIIMFSVPLALVGGFAGLRIVHDISLRNVTQPPQMLDVLTMLGFFILVGVVVNNAILLVHQALNFMRGEETEGGRTEPMRAVDAIVESVRTRIRPIMMSVLTSAGGMFPLVLNPGAGSEMYRGLGSVVIGGLLVSTFFTLILVPLMFSLSLDMTAGMRSLLGKDPEPWLATRPESSREDSEAVSA